MCFPFLSERADCKYSKARLHKSFPQIFKDLTAYVGALNCEVILSIAQS